jgi:hypothetical protein
MTMADLYWSIYKNLERELIALSEVIHFDDSQLGVYSVKIADLLVRTCVEIEALSKQLYLSNGGIAPDNEKDLYYDTICLGFLNDKWDISKKIVNIVNPNMYFEIDGNKILAPLHKAHKRGTSGSKWARAYQAVKHNREKNLSLGNIGNFITSLAALFVLNVYHKNTNYLLGKNANDFDERLNSEVFAVKYSLCTGFNRDTDSSLNSKMDDCIYIVKGTDKTRAEYEQAMRKLMDDSLTETSDQFNIYLSSLSNEERNSLSQDELTQKYKEIQNKCFQKIGEIMGPAIYTTANKLYYEAVLNMSQFKKLETSQPDDA